MNSKLLNSSNYNNDDESPPSYYSDDIKSSVIKNPPNITVEDKILEDGEDINEFERFCMKWGFDQFMEESYEVFKLRSRDY